MDLEEAAEKSSRAFGDDDHIRFGDALKARRKVRRLAYHHALLRLIRWYEVTHHDQSGCNTNPDLLESVRVEPSHCGNQLKPSPYCSLGVVLMGLRIAKVHEDAIPDISGDEPAEVAHSLGHAFLIGRDDLSQVLRVHAGGKRGRTDKVHEHHRDLAALGLVPWARFGPRRKLGRGGGLSGKLGNRPDKSPTIAEAHDANPWDISVREAPKDLKIDPVLGKAVRILGQSERSKPLSDRRHCATHPVARGNLRKRAAIRDRDLLARQRMPRRRTRAPQLLRMRLPPAAPTGCCRCSR